MCLAQELVLARFIAHLKPNHNAKLFSFYRFQVFHVVPRSLYLRSHLIISHKSYQIVTNLEKLNFRVVEYPRPSKYAWLNPVNTQRLLGIKKQLSLPRFFRILNKAVSTVHTSGVVFFVLVRNRSEGTRSYYKLTR